MPKRVKVTHQNESGRNTNFHDNRTGKDLTRTQFVKQIKNSEYPGYEIRKINGVDTPVSKPDKTKNNNLG